MKTAKTRSPSLIELRVEVALELVPRVEALLFEQELPQWQLVEVREPEPRAWLKGLFTEKPAARAAWKAIRGGLPPRVSALKPELKTVRDQDWRESHKAHFRRWSFGGLHWVPVWEKDSFVAPAGEAVLWLDPGMAFGTGNHETTRLCCERLVAFAHRQRTEGRSLEKLHVIDCGCGSGILALSAAKLGFGRIFGFDVDPEALRVSRENASLNGVNGTVEWAEADLATGLARRKADLVLANIQSDILARNATALLRSVRPGGQLVLSGLLGNEVDATRSSFGDGRPGAPRFEHRLLGDWADVVVTPA